MGVDELVMLWDRVAAALKGEDQDYAFILAPSGSGKSTAIENGLRALDADQQPEIHAVYTTAREKYGEKWWRNPEAQQMKERLLGPAFQALMKRVKTEPVLTAENQAIDSLVHRRVLDPSEVLVVIPSAEAVVAGQQARAREKHGWPAESVETVKRWVESYRRSANVAGYDTISEEEP